MTNNENGSSSEAVKSAVLFVRSNQQGLGSRAAAMRFAEIQRIAAKVTAHRLGASIDKQYIDYSGLGQFGQRGELLSMLGDLMIHRYDYLITPDWSRLVDVSNTEELRLVQDTARDSGTQIVTVGGLLDELPAESYLNELIYAWRNGGPRLMPHGRTA
jgi:hypothetical protein